MIKFIINKIFFSIAVVLGVLLLTFLLFNVAAGDPAAPLLGKNASPAEVESLRMKLGSNLPVIYGKYIATESFNAPDFRGKNFNSSAINAEFNGSNHIVLNNGGGKFLAKFCYLYFYTFDLVKRIIIKFFGHLLNAIILIQDDKSNVPLKLLKYFICY